jgi:lambda family phage portal protein
MDWLDRLTAVIAPRWTMRRLRARAVLEVFTRTYEAATVGRRTQGWRRSTGDANAALLQGLARLRDNARDLVRNNPYAESAVATIADHTVGWGIVAKPAKGTPVLAAGRFTQAWKAWAETPACDSEGRLDFPGLQKLVMRAVAESGEVLIRRRWRRPEDTLPLPLQLQILEADYLDALKDGLVTPGGGSIVQGVEYDAIGRRVAYWLFREHPGSSFVGLRASGAGQSVRVPASEILHVFKPGRPGQTRGPSWFAPVLLRLKDHDEYEDAALMKQKIAACLAVLTTDVDGTTPPLGVTDAAQPTWDTLEPGMISNLPPGRSVTVVEPPSVSEHAAYSQTVLRAIASGLGVTYEDITGDYSQMPFSAARMSRIRHWARVEDWRWRMLIPQFCDPVWSWAVEAARVAAIIRDPIQAEWTASPMPMIEPDKEGLAYQRNIRSGIQTLSEVIRERGYDPASMLAEYAADNAILDRLGLIFDSDPRNTTQQGGPRQPASASSTPAAAESPVPAAKPARSSPGNGHYPPVQEFDIERAWRNVETTIGLLAASERGRGEPATVNVPVTIEAGAIQTTVSPPPPAEVRIDNPVTFAEGAMRVEVDAKTTIEDGAVTVTPPPEPKITVIRTPRRRRSGTRSVRAGEAPTADDRPHGDTSIPASE